MLTRLARQAFNVLLRGFSGRWSEYVQKPTFPVRSLIAVVDTKLFSLSSICNLLILCSHDVVQNS